MITRKNKKKDLLDSLRSSRGQALNWLITSSLVIRLVNSLVLFLHLFLSSYIRDCGLGGDFIATMNDRLPYYIKMIPNVEYVIGCVGRNDSSLTYEQFIVQLTEFMDICMSNHITPILTTIEPDMDGYNNTVVPDVNTWIRSSGQKYIDIDKVFHNANGTINTSLYLADGVHPTVDGHLRIYRRIQMDCPFLF